MILNVDSWYVVRNTPGVTGFVGVGNKPLPLEEEEAQKILNQMGLGESVPRIDLNVGETVRIKSGPFENFVGTVAEIYPEKGKLKVMVSMFGRDTPVELDFGQIEKMN
jgi:transcriptional antiterminator NusG